MRRSAIFLALIFVILSGASATTQLVETVYSDNSTLSFTHEQVISVELTGVYEGSGWVRVLLDTDQGTFVVAEYFAPNPEQDTVILLDEGGGTITLSDEEQSHTYMFSNSCVETCTLDSVQTEQLRIEVVDGSFYLDSVEYEVQPQRAPSRGETTLDVITAEVDDVVLNATDHPLNRTDANLTAHPVNPTNFDTLIHNWRINGASIAVLNMPFDTNDSVTAKDYSSHQNNGTIGAGVTWNSSGISGGAYHFNGTSGASIDVVDDDSLKGFTEFTVAAWINAENFSHSTGNNWPRIIAKEINAGSDEGFFLTASHLGMIRYRATLEPSVLIDSTGSGLNTDEWYFIVVTANSTDGYLYINGVLNNSVSGNALPETGVSNLSIGDSPGSDVRMWNGMIDGVQIFNKTLGPEQVAAMYNEGTPRYNLTVSQETTVGENWSVAVTSNNVTHDHETVVSNTVTIQGLPAVCVNETGVCWGTIQEAINNATAAQTVVITTNATYEENITIDKQLTLTQNSTDGMPLITSTNLTTVTITAASVVVNAINVSTIGTTGTTRSISISGASTNLTNLHVSHNSSNATSAHTVFVGASNVLLDNVSVFNINNESTSLYMDYSNDNLTINNSYFNGNTRIDITQGNYSIHNSELHNGRSGGWIMLSSDSPSAADIRHTLFNKTVGTGGTIGIGGYHYLYNVTIIGDNTNSLGIGKSTIEASFINITGRIDTYGSATNITLKDTTFITTYADSISIIGWDSTGLHNITIINSTILPSDIGFAGFDTGDEANVTFISYLDVYVNNSLGAAVEGATVNTTDSFDTLVSSLSTSALGTLSRQNITYAILNSTASSTPTITWYTNHSVNASATGYSSNSTSVNMSSSQEVSLMLSMEYVGFGSPTSWNWRSSNWIGKDVNGSSRTFDGVDDYVQVTGADTPASGAWTLSLWARPANVSGSSFDYALSAGAYLGSTTANPGLSIYFGESGVGNPYWHIHTQTDANDTVHIFTGVAPTESWTHIAFRFNGSDGYAFYLNGTQQLNWTLNGRLSFSTDMHIGRRYDADIDRYFEGDIADVTMWSSALSDAQITQLGDDVPPIHPATIDETVNWYIPLGNNPEVAFGTQASSLNFTTSGAAINYAPPTETLARLVRVGTPSNWTWESAAAEGLRPSGSPLLWTWNR